MWLLMRITLGRGSHWIYNFKNKINHLSVKEVQQYYRDSANVHLERETDLNSACVKKILNSIEGNSVLDIACGRGYLTKRLAENYSVTGADFVIASELKTLHPEITWDEVDINYLGYADDQFDTVVCAHTLEHLVDIQGAITELRRVTKNVLIIVLPKQRVYQYTFDLHLHFFYYKWQVEMLMNSGPNESTGHCENINGDWVYIENMKAS